MAARNYDDSLVATDSIYRYEPGANGFPEGSDEYLLFRDAIAYLQEKGAMPPGSLDNFEEAVTKAKNGFITWESIDRSWKSYEFALKKAPQEAPTGHDGVKQIWEGLWDQLHENFSYLKDNEEDAAEDEGEDGRDGNGDSD